MALCLTDVMEWFNVRHRFNVDIRYEMFTGLLYDVYDNGCCLP